MADDSEDRAPSSSERSGTGPPIVAIGASAGGIRALQAFFDALPGDTGRFDVVIAHGFYSWVPPDVRDAMFVAMRAHLAPHGLGFASYNLLPGAWIRRIGWDAMRFHTRAEADPAKRVASAREVIDILAEAWKTADPKDFDTVSKAIKAIKYRGVCGTYTFATDTNSPLSYPTMTDDAESAQAHLIFQVQDGQHTIISPASHKQADMKPAPWM